MNLSVILPLASRSGRLFRLLMWVLIITAAGFSFLLLSLRYWLLPEIEQYRENIASAISHASGQNVTIGGINANWDGFRPHMRLRTIKVHDKEGNITLLLHQLEGTLSWLSLLHGELQFREIVIEQPDLIVRRDVAGAIHVAGFAFNRQLTGDENGFSDWLLRQRQVIINNANILWQDDQRDAPELELLVNLRLENRGNHHRFGIRATPPAELAAQLDMRGDFTGESLNIPEQWQGQLFAQIDHADIAAWRAWLPFPPEMKFKRGIGALRMWAGIDGTDMRKLTVDMRLHNVKTQLAEDLPELNLIRLKGRIGWKKINDGTKEAVELSARGLSASVGEKRELQPVNLLLQMISSRGRKHGGGILNIDKLNLDTFAYLADYLPISQPMRDQLGKVSPRGELHYMQAKWDGEWPTPEYFSAKGGFANVSMKKSGTLPAFSGITGNIDISERGGTLNLNSQQVRLELPDVLHEPLVLGTLTGQASWNFLAEEDSIAFQFNNISFSNPHAAGLAYGSYRFIPGKPGLVDLAAHLTRADARYLGRYMPVTANRNFQGGLYKLMVAGEFLDARLQLKGDLADFPFVRRDSGIFRLQMKASGLALDHIPGWPRIENISGNLQFHGGRMEIDASQADILDVELSKVKLYIADITAADATLESEGEASGATNEFIKFAAKSNGDSYASSLANDIGFTGNGKLLFKLDIPLNRPGDIKLTGSYQFLDNQIDLGKRIPNLGKVNGVLTFSDSKIESENITAQFLGGTVAVSSASMPGGGIRLSATGKANLDNLIPPAQSRNIGPSQLSWTRYLSGGTDWRAVVQIHNKLVDVSVDSSLQGITSNLPEPFSKVATDVTPLHFERKAVSLDRDVLNLSYGGLVKAKVKRLRDNASNYQVERGIVSFGTTPLLLPEKMGISVRGTLPLLDLDQWRSVLKQLSSEAEPSLNPTAIDLRVGAADFLGKRLNDISLNASKDDGLWHSTVTSREIKGGISWEPTGNGKVVARLRTLIMPANSPVSSPDIVTQTQPLEKNLPGIDVMADNFIVGEKHLGSLELIANQQDQGWRIEKLHITNSDSSLRARGIWQSHAIPPRIQATITLDASDIGNFLTHLGYPDRVERGSGKLEGVLSWNGLPQSINYPTLSGNFKVKARRGQFPKFEPGIGRLFGMFDLRALPRRITLDFHDVFSEGFGFDDISGDVRIIRGVAFTDDLRIEGPAAKIVMDGELNLETETQKLHVRVTPSLGLATPVVGIVSKALQNPQSNQYDVTGTWANPTVTKILPEAREYREHER